MLQQRSSAFRAAEPAEGEGLSIRLLKWSALGPDEAAAWHELGRQAETPSVFAEPWMMRRSLVHCDPDRQALLAVVLGDGDEWLGAIPVVRARRQGRTPVPGWAAWSHPNQFAGSPLVRRSHAERFWRGLLDGLSRHGGGRVALALGQLPVDDPVTRVLLDICERERRSLAIDRRWQRARLDARPGAEPPEQSPKQRSRMRGLERKLEAEVGPIEFVVDRDSRRTVPALDAFLELERSGWKGEAGSALACADGTRGFFLDVASAAARKERLEVATLVARGRTLAMSTQLVGVERTYGFKAAYDEAFAAYAPGLLLLNRLTRHYIERGIGEIDSCAVPDQQPVSRLWPERRDLIDCRVALGGAVRTRVFSGMLACERMARRVRRLTGVTASR